MHEILATLKQIRGMPWLAAAAAVGLLLLLFGGTEDGGNAMTYPEQVEHRIAQMTATLPGVEDVSVLVTLEPAGGGTFSVSGTDTDERRICGIAVTCIGGADAQTRLAILDMLCAAFDLTSDRVWVGGKEPSADHGHK